MYYRQFRDGINNITLVPACIDFDIQDRNRDYYTSIYEYTDEQYKHFQQTQSIAGITEVTTPRLVWDFDGDEKDISSAQYDAIKLCNRLSKAGLKLQDIRICYSGSKGIHVEVETTHRFNRDEFTAIQRSLAHDLPTYDTKINDHARAFRIIGTKHKASGFYKIPLTYKELSLLTHEEIVTKAKNLSNIDRANFSWGIVALPEEVLKLKTFKETPKPILSTFTLEELSMADKPKFLTNCRWALQQGFTQKGDRNTSLLCLAATYKNFGFPLEVTHHMLKGVAELQAKRNNLPTISKEEIYKTVTKYVYSDNFNGGQFTCKEVGNWLHTYCSRLGRHQCDAKSDKVFIDMKDLTKTFTNFAVEIEKNKIKTGLQKLDDNVTICTSTLVGLLGSPGSGKTSFALNILRNASNAGLSPIFFSMDMGIPLVYLKMIQKIHSLTPNAVMDIYKNKPQEAAKIDKEISEQYGNIRFSFKGGLDVEGIRDSILTHQKENQNKTKLVVVDYLECIQGPFSDSTANTAIIANQLKDIANETETCVLLLLQTQKHAGQPDEPLLSMKNIKGSSVIEQACSVILTLWREGYSPKFADRDNFISIATVKDRLSGLWTQDFSWKGINGEIKELNPEQKEELEQLRKEKNAAKVPLPGGFG